MRREIHERAFRLALMVATLRTDPSYRAMVRDLILRQLARATFSVAGNLEESLAAYSKADFAAKVAISAKEGRETNFWLRLGKEAGVLTPEECERLMPEAREVSVVVSTIARRARMNPEPPPRRGKLRTSPQPPAT
jgi:four helix bundle protein